MKRAAVSTALYYFNATLIVVIGRSRVRALQCLGLSAERSFLGRNRSLLRCFLLRFIGFSLSFMKSRVFEVRVEVRLSVLRQLVAFAAGHVSDHFAGVLGDELGCSVGRGTTSIKHGFIIFVFELFRLQACAEKLVNEEGNLVGKDVFL